MFWRCERRSRQTQAKCSAAIGGFPATFCASCAYAETCLRHLSGWVMHSRQSLLMRWCKADLVGVGTWSIQVGRRSSDELGTGVRKELLVGGVHPAHHLHHLLIVSGAPNQASVISAPTCPHGIARNLSLPLDTQCPGMSCEFGSNKFCEALTKWKGLLWYRVTMYGRYAPHGIKYCLLHFKLHNWEHYLIHN